MDRRAIAFAFSSLVLGLLIADPVPAQGPPAFARAGEITVLLVDDFELATERKDYELTVQGEDEPYQLDFRGPPPFALRSGQRVKVMANELPGRRLGVREITLLEAPPQNGGGGGGGGGGKGGGGKGSRSSAVVLINLLDANSLLTAAQAEDMMWGPVNSTQDVYLQDSRGKINFVRDSDNDNAADVYGPYDVAMTAAGSCSYRSWSNAAYQMAEAEGVSLNNRDHRIYVLTGFGTNGCSFGGVAELDGDDVWINYNHEFVFFHELGHNLNLNHAGSDPDNDGGINSAYGDGSCFMGASYRDVFLNAPHNETMGYISSQGGAIVNVPTTPGIYNYILEPLAWDQAVAVGPQILKIPRNDLGRVYYLSLRNDTSYDANLHDSYQTGVSVHWYRPDQPGTVTGYVTTLADGESFVDAINGITVTQNASAADNSWADVTVDIVETYDVATPGFDVRSLSGQLAAENTVGPNDPSVYAIDLQNNDGDGTPASTWTLSARNVPAGMVATFGQTQVTLGPGESQTVALTIDPNGASDGATIFYVDALDEDGVEPAHLAVDDYGRLVVDSVSIKPEPPTGLSGSTYTSKGKLYLTLQWTASPSADVAKYRIFIDETPVPLYWRNSTGTSYSNRWTLDQGTYDFVVAAENSAGKLSEMSNTATVVIQKGK